MTPLGAWGIRGKTWETVVKVNTLFRKSLHRSLDPKGRLMLPPEYRDAVASTSAEGVFVLTGFYGRLVGYTVPDWEHNVEQLSSVKLPSLKLSRFMSKVLGLAEEVAIDAQGRVRIPQPLIHEAGLVKDAVLVGLGRKFEIWDQTRFEALELEDVSDELAAGGIDISL